MNGKRIYYFDNNATTQPAPEVVQIIQECLNNYWANPSSGYEFARGVKQVINAARQNIAALLNAEPDEIVFTSCGTESINSAIHSAICCNDNKKHIVISSVEHHATLNFAKALEKRGFKLTYLPVNSEGLFSDLKLVEKAIAGDTAIVSVMMANNETGVIFPIEEIAAICHRKGVLFHTDAVQALGKIPIDVKKLGVDYLSISGHKIYALKGIGALYVRKGAPFSPYIIGGNQEQGRRGGTENTVGIAAFGKAAELALKRLDQIERIRRLRDKLEEGILNSIKWTYLNGSKENRIPNTTNISFDFVDSEAILHELDRFGVCASSGAACSTGEIEPSHTLLAMGVSKQRAKSAVRFSLGFYNTEEEVDYLLSILPGIIKRLRASSPAIENL
ncbi:MAG: cysteine desulfurase family protein [Verrucomicrobiia bacterium]